MTPFTAIDWENLSRDLREAREAAQSLISNAKVCGPTMPPDRTFVLIIEQSEQASKAVNAAGVTFAPVQGGYAIGVPKGLVDPADHAAAESLMIDRMTTAGWNVNRRIHGVNSN
jgi:hypothetical protein